MPRKIIIDTDPGIDDSMAIFYALNSPEIELLGLTTIFGNASTEICTINALRLLEIAGRSDIPVYKGAEKPISSERRGSPEFVHGPDGQGNSNLSPPKTSVQNQTALEFLHKTIRDNPGEVTLVPIGPLTNIAELFIHDSTIDQGIKEIILMGGNAISEGNATPTAEANIINDPEAADIVFSANCEISMVGLDVTNKVFMTKEEINILCQFDDPRSEHLKKIIPFYYDFLSSFFEKEGMPTHDSSAITYLIDRSLFRTLNYPIKVETEGISRGKTWMGMGISRNEGGPSERLKPWEGRKNVNVCVDVDAEKVISLILDRLSY
jgi:uridine nucleosidase